MTAKPCKACSHPDRGVIDRALLVAGQSPRSIVRRYRDVSRLEVQRHRDRCLEAPTGGRVPADGPLPRN